MKLARASIIALPACLVFGAAIACGSSSSGGSGGDGTSTSTSGGTALSGAYVPAGTAAQNEKAEFRALVFTSPTEFFAYKNNCTGSAACRDSGTYTYDGQNALTLSHDGTTEHLSFSAVTRAGGGSSGSLVGQTHPLDLISTVGSIIDASTSSLTGDGGGLLGQILSALLNGALMALQQALMGSGDDGGTGDDDSSPTAFCDPIAATADCAAQGGLGVNFNTDGTCTCTLPQDAGQADANINITINIGGDGGTDGGTQTITITTGG